MAPRRGVAFRRPPREGGGLGTTGHPVAPPPPSGAVEKPLQAYTPAALVDCGSTSGPGEASRRGFIAPSRARGHMSGIPGTAATTDTSNIPAGGRVAIQGDGIIHEIQWSDALPWWLLFRAAGAAFSSTVVLLATLGALAVWGGWSLADRIGMPAGAEAAGAVSAASPATGTGVAASPRVALPERIRAPLEALGRPLPPPVVDLVRLATVPLDPATTLPGMLGALARLGWFVAVWSIFGTAIARHVALKLAGEEVPGVRAAVWFGSQKWLSAFNAVAFVLLGIVALSLPGALLGLLMRTDVGLAIAGVVWPVVLLGGIVLAILAIGVACGWPLMVGGIGVERGDSFQAISTAFSYLYQRPLHYAFYLLVAVVVALPALLVAEGFAGVTSNLALWATSLGMGHARTAEVLAGLETVAAGGEAALGIRALGFWGRVVGAIVGSFGWGYFWSIATAAYLLLRRDVDGTELDEVVVEELPGEAG